MKSITKALLASLVAGSALTEPCKAAVVIYTDRAAWEAAVSGMATVTETFDTMAPGTLSAPTVFPTGVTMTSGVGTISSLAWTTIGQGLGLEMTSSSMTFSPATPGVRVFAFDFADNERPPGGGGGSGAGPRAAAGSELLYVRFGGASYVLPFTGTVADGVSPDDFGFFGVVATTSAEISGGNFELYQEMGTDPPRITIDRLTFAVPEPATASLPLAALGLLAGARRRRWA